MKSLQASGVQRSSAVNSREVTRWLYTSTWAMVLPALDPTVSPDTMLPSWMEFTQGNWKDEDGGVTEINRTSIFKPRLPNVFSPNIIPTPLPAHVAWRRGNP